MTENNGQRLRLVDPALAKAMSHPLRRRVLSVLQDGNASPVKIAKTLHEPLNTIAYHVRVLCDLGVVELVATAKRRGALEHTYRLTPRWTVEEEAFSEVPGQGLASPTNSVIRQIVTGDLSADSFQAEPALLERHLLRLDDAGRRQVVKLVNELLEKVNELAADGHRAPDAAGPTDELVVLFFATKL